MRTCLPVSHYMASVLSATGRRRQVVTLRVSGSVLACFLYKINGFLRRCVYYIINRKWYVQEWVSGYKYNMLQLLYITKCCRLADFVLQKYKIIKIVQCVFFNKLSLKRYPFKGFPCIYNWTICPYIKYVWFKENFINNRQFIQNKDNACIICCVHHYNRQVLWFH